MKSVNTTLESAIKNCLLPLQILPHNALQARTMLVSSHTKSLLMVVHATHK